MGPPVNEGRLNGVKEMDIVMMFIAGEEDIIMHLVTLQEMRCGCTVITHRNEFPSVLIFYFFQIKPPDTNMLHYVFLYGNPRTIKS